jgi:hypothetical protein
MSSSGFRVPSIVEGERTVAAILETFPFGAARCNYMRKSRKMKAGGVFLKRTRPSFNGGEDAKRV